MTPNPSIFSKRHHGKSAQELAEMLGMVGVSDLDQLIEETIPSNIRLKQPLFLPGAQSEQDFLADFANIASKNKVFSSYIGMGYYDTHVPNVILRNILENPSWYTAYTPYQAEIAQGRLEMLLNFQTIVIELTGMEIANASLLDEGTAAAEAATMMYAVKTKKTASTLFISEKCHPQTIEVVLGRCNSAGIPCEVGHHESFDLLNPKYYGVLLQYPATDGNVYDYSTFISQAKAANLMVTVAADLLALTLLKSPGEMGADVVVGTAQRFGIPFGYGGPHAAFFATKDSYKRSIPGRIIGVSKDAQGNRALRMALQTREQHIRREKASSNICTAQVLLSVMSAAYGIYHGPEGLKYIARRTHTLAANFKIKLLAAGYEVLTDQFFDTITIKTDKTAAIRKAAEEQQINLRYWANGDISVSFDETKEDLNQLSAVFGLNNTAIEAVAEVTLARQDDFMQQEVFHKYQTEHEMLRYLKRLESKDLSLVHSMISLGSCTMKLNATAEMIPVTWKTLGGIHPFAPKEQTLGYQTIFENLTNWLAEITGFETMSLQPNSGAQGEYAGLMVVKSFLNANGQNHRNIALIPSSAHGTNPASAVMAGMQVVIVKCKEDGDIDVEDLKAKIEHHKENLAVLMVTYPSTHGVFEETIIEICDAVHAAGGQVYMDGANMNAQVGLTSPKNIGADVCHLNLHKTFCIPHGGGGPGMGPIGVAKHLVPHLPNHTVMNVHDAKGINAISAAPYGSASILAISYAYIAMMGSEGLTMATKLAILNANYIKDRLKDHYPVLYLGKNNRCAHEMILDCRQFKGIGIEAEDIAKRLMDYGFHAPTLSFPVAGTLMIEPTESESKAELDRFCDAMIAIKAEIDEVATGTADSENNVLKNAPHTAEVLLADEWSRPYSRQKAAYPLAYVKEAKFWPAVSRIDSAYGDRNLVCSCEPTSAYSEVN